MRLRSSNEMRPPMVAAADTAVRNPIPTQNNSSVRHHPEISDVAMTAVAQPLTMLTAAVADAADGFGRPAAAGAGATGCARGMKLVSCSPEVADSVGGASSGSAGNDPVG